MGKRRFPIAKPRQPMSESQLRDQVEHDGHAKDILLDLVEYAYHVGQLPDHSLRDRFFKIVMEDAELMAR